MKVYRLTDATFYDCINTIYQVIKPFLDYKMSIFEEYGAFKEILVYVYSRSIVNNRIKNLCLITDGTIKMLRM